MAPSISRQSAATRARVASIASFTAARTAKSPPAMGPWPIGHNPRPPGVKRSWQTFLCLLARPRHPSMCGDSFLNDATISAANRIRITAAFSANGPSARARTNRSHLLKDKDAELRAHGVWLFGVNGFDKAVPDLFEALADSDALVRRRACEALIRLGAEPPVARVWGVLLNEKDRFVRTATRLVLRAHLIRKNGRVKSGPSPRVIREINETHGPERHRCPGPYRSQALRLRGADFLARLHGNQTHPKRRVNQLSPQPAGMAADDRGSFSLARLSNGVRSGRATSSSNACKMFPHADMRLSTVSWPFSSPNSSGEVFWRSRFRDDLASSDGHPKKTITCNRFITPGCMRRAAAAWTPETAKAMTAWYEGTRAWPGGSNLAPVLESIYKECAVGFAGTEK